MASKSSGPVIDPSVERRLSALERQTGDIRGLQERLTSAEAKIESLQEQIRQLPNKEPANG